jgi:hypothetical protein
MKDIITNNRHTPLSSVPEYNDPDFRVVKCPICGEDTLDNHYICSNCYWEYDGKTLTEEYSSANRSTVKDYCINFFKN